MRKLLLSLLLLFFAMIAKEASAADYVGGELTYSWLADSTYQFTLKLYSPCNGSITPMTSVPVCYYNNCNGQTGSINLLAINMPQPAPPAYKEYSFRGNVTLPSRCAKWTFYSSIASRPASGNLQAGSYNMYLEATLNNFNAQGNSSVVLNAPPVSSAPYSTFSGINTAPFDANGDSLAFSLVMPATALTSCVNSNAGTDIPFNNNIYNLSNNPIGAGNTFMLDPQTGLMSFIASEIGTFTYAIQIDEYRGNVKTGSVRRDAQIKLDSTYFLPSMLQIANGNYQNCYESGGRIFAVANTQVGFCVKAWINGNVPTILKLTSNNTVALPGSNMTITGQNTDSVSGCLLWTPALADTGLHTIVVTVRDSSTAAPCDRGYAPVTDRLWTIPVFITKPTSVTSVVKKEDVKIYPNPASNIVHIDAVIPTRAVLRNVEGRVVAETEKTTLDIHTLASGLYFMSIYSRQGVLLRTEKITKIMQ